MKAYAEENDIMSRPRRSLIGSMVGEKILLATPLLKWYLEHGLEVTHVYQVIEYTPKPCFKPFDDAVSNAHRAGDADHSKAIIADTIKLVGNSSYVKTITNKERHRQVKFCNDDDVPSLINSPFFRELNPIDDTRTKCKAARKKLNWIYPFKLDFLSINMENYVCYSSIMTF